MKCCFSEGAVIRSQSCLSHESDFTGTSFTRSGDDRYETLIDRLTQNHVRPIQVASHPRSGTHLLIDTLRLNFAGCRSWKWWGERNDRLYLDLDLVVGDPPLSPELIGRILSRSRRPLVKTHAWPRFDKILLQAISAHPPRGLLSWMDLNSTHLYVYRDGREVMRSLHTFMRDFDPVARVSLSEFIRQTVHGVSRAAAWAKHVRKWAYREGAYCVKMEELIEQPTLIAGLLADHLGEQLNKQVTLPRQVTTRLQRPLRRLMHSRPQSTAILPRHQLSPPPSWKTVFSRDDCKFFQDETDNLLVTLMYEQSINWCDDCTS